MAGLGHTVAETGPYLADCRHLGLSEAERKHIVDAVAADPEGGDVIVGSGGARKVRVAKSGGGKRGGYRLISAFIGSEAPVYLTDRPLRQE